MRVNFHVMNCHVVSLNVEINAQLRSRNLLKP